MSPLCEVTGAHFPKIGFNLSIDPTSYFSSSFRLQVKTAQGTINLQLQALFQIPQGRRWNFVKLGKEGWSRWWVAGTARAAANSLWPHKFYCLPSSPLFSSSASLSAGGCIPQAPLCYLYFPAQFSVFFSLLKYIFKQNPSVGQIETPSTLVYNKVGLASSLKSLHSPFPNEPTFFRSFEMCFPQLRSFSLRTFSSHCLWCVFLSWEAVAAKRSLITRTLWPAGTKIGRFTSLYLFCQHNS